MVGSMVDPSFVFFFEDVILIIVFIFYGKGMKNE